MPGIADAGAAPGRRTWAAFAGYVALTVVATWPLAPQIASGIAGDFGDPLFVAWVMTWVARHLTAAVTGDPGALVRMWDAPIFAPEPNTLAYSEHFTGQAIQALPVLWATANPLLAYNLLFAASFALTALAAYLLAVELTGSRLGAFLAGVLVAFNEYRLFWSLSHLHTLSIHWWVFALWGLERFAASARTRPLAWATVSLVALNLSSGYYMLFTAPFTALFAAWALWRHGRLAEGGAWARLIGAAAVTGIAAVPFVVPYLRMRDALGYARPLDQVIAQSLTIDAYLQVLPWFGPLLALAVLGAVLPLRARPPREGAVRLALVAGALLATWMVLGPEPRFRGETFGLPGIYGWFYAHVPGFSGLRVVHRFVTIQFLFLAMLAAAGAAQLARWRVGVAVAVALTAAATSIAWLRPMPVSGVLDSPGLAPRPAYLVPDGRTWPRIYRLAATLPREAVLVELPFGDMYFDVHVTYFTLAHGLRTLNGYSGVFPPSQARRVAALRDPLANADAAWAALSPATHAIVHDAAWPDDTGRRLREWLASRGARQLAAADGAHLFALPPRSD